MTNKRYHPDFHMLASMGYIPGITPFFKFGENKDIDTATDPEDVITGGGSKLFPTAASTISIVSTSASDTDGGTGINKLIISGLDSNWDILTEEVTLAGLTPVVSTNSFLRVDRMYATLSGSAQESVGEIIATHSEGDIADIKAGEAQSLIAAYPVPRDYTLLLTSFKAALTRKSSAAIADVHFEINTFGSNSWRVQQVIGLNNTGTSSIQRTAEEIWFNVPEKTDVRLRVHDVTANDTGIIGAFDGYLINNKTFAI